VQGSPRLPLHVVLSVALALGLGLGACRDSSSSSSSGGSASSATIRWRDGGADLLLADRALVVPRGELAEGAHPTVTGDGTGKRLAYATASGDVRLVYVVGGALYLGPTARPPLDLRAAPDLDHALGALFVNAGDRRAELVADVTKDKGEAGVARMLADGAAVESAAWDEAYKRLTEPGAAEVKTRLAALLERGAPSAGLRRAVALVSLREPARAPALAARVRELTEPVKEPRATAVMLRALAALDKASASTIACEVLGRAPLDVANVKGPPEEIDRPGRAALVEASLLAIAAAGASCSHVAALLGEDHCLPSFRCGEGGPLSGREPSRQDEPLCAKAELEAAIKRELERAPLDVLALTGGARPALFAFAALAGEGKLPPLFAVAHARRRYALVQPKEPACESATTPGTPCRCDEAVVRDGACRHPESATVSVGVCKVEIDDKQKKLLNVVATLPP
jgi:hypothetical protein